MAGLSSRASASFRSASISYALDTRQFLVDILHVVPPCTPSYWCSRAMATLSEKGCLSGRSELPVFGMKIGGGFKNVGPYVAPWGFGGFADCMPPWVLIQACHGSGWFWASNNRSCSNAERTVPKTKPTRTAARLRPVRRGYLSSRRNRYSWKGRLMSSQWCCSVHRSDDWYQP